MRRNTDTRPDGSENRFQFQLKCTSFCTAQESPDRFMKLRFIPIVQSTQSSVLRRSIHLTSIRYAVMEGGVTSEELEEAMKSRLSAVHTQVHDISGSILDSDAGYSYSGGCGQSYEVVIVQTLLGDKSNNCRCLLYLRKK
jgi:hypothetical protein